MTTCARSVVPRSVSAWKDSTMSAYRPRTLASKSSGMSASQPDRRPEDAEARPDVRGLVPGAEGHAGHRHDESLVEVEVADLVLLGGRDERLAAPAGPGLFERGV